MSSESEDDGSEQRSATVCFLCRQRKTKCDRTLPSCGFCVKAKVECQYVPKPKKRGLRAGYVSELESRIDNLENELNNLKHERFTTAPPPVVFTPSNANHISMASTPTSYPNASLPSSWASTPAKRRRLNPESDAAIKDLMTLPHTYLYTLADLWFKETQPWSPILSQQHIQTALEALPTPVDYIEDIELRVSQRLLYCVPRRSLLIHYRHCLLLRLRTLHRLLCWDTTDGAAYHNTSADKY